MDIGTRGFFVTFEGGEGTGKTTQSKMLSEYLNSIGVPTIWTREIGGVEVAEEIRSIFFKYDIDVVTEYFLSTAARNEHIINKIRPSLDAGICVICDRFIDTSSVYRSVFGKYTQEEIYADHQKLFPDCWPNITLLLDMNPQISFQRVNDRNGDKSKYDNADIKMHSVIRNGFLYSAKLYPKRFKIIDAEQDLALIHKDIIEQINVTLLANA